MRIKIDASLLLLVLIILFFVVGIVFSVYTFRSNPVEDYITANRVINVLFVMEENKMPVSTYVLMYYPVTKRAAIFDIPEDMGLLITKINLYDRIDKVYDSAHISSYENEIEKLLGVEISFSVVITKDNLVSIVDLLEGVEIFIPSPVLYKADDKVILFPSGMTVLDGDKAGVYAAYSLPYEERDMEMFRRQRFFLGLLNRQIQMNKRLQNPSLAKIYYSFFKTSMSKRSLMQLFNEFANIDTGRLNIQSVAGDLREISGQMLVIPLWNGNLIKEVVRQTLGTLTREVDNYSFERILTVEVLNGTAINGLAGKTADMLRNFGYDIISIGNADRNNYESTVIVNRNGEESMVKTFADVIRCKNIRNEASDNTDDNSQDYEYKADITLIIGRNFDGRYVTGN